MIDEKVGVFTSKKGGKYFPFKKFDTHHHDHGETSCLNI